MQVVKRWTKKTAWRVERQAEWKRDNIPDKKRSQSRKWIGRRGKEKFARWIV